MTVNVDIDLELPPGADINSISGYLDFVLTQRSGGQVRMQITEQDLINPIKLAMALRTRPGIPGGNNS